MLRLAITALLAGSISLITAQLSPSYVSFTLDPAVPTRFAGTISYLGTLVGTSAENKVMCSRYDTCIGLICRVGANTDCTLLRVGDSSDSAVAGFSSVHWRYGVPTGPRCTRTKNRFASPSGACTCDAATEMNDTPFGCQIRQSFPSQAANRQRMARNKILPGVHKKASFE